MSAENHIFEKTAHHSLQKTNSDSSAILRKLTNKILMTSGSGASHRCVQLFLIQSISLIVWHKKLSVLAQNFLIDASLFQNVTGSEPWDTYNLLMAICSRPPQTQKIIKTTYLFKNKIFFLIIPAFIISAPFAADPLLFDPVPEPHLTCLKQQHKDQTLFLFFYFSN